MRRRDVIVAVLACLCLLVPTIGSFYPPPPYPVTLSPYSFVGYLALGGAWLYTMSRRRGILADIEAGLEQTLQPHRNHRNHPAADL